MADENKQILSVVAAPASKLSDIGIKNAQLIFVKDKPIIALDLGGKRIFYNQIVELQTESDRQALLAPVNQTYYFVVGTAVLWTYNNGWIQITTPPQDIVFIGDVLPELGSENTLYVNKTDKNISYWDKGSQSYKIVGERTAEITVEAINALFNN